METRRETARHTRTEAEERLHPLFEDDVSGLEAAFRRGAVPAWNDVQGDTFGRIVALAPDASAMLRLLARIGFDSAPSRWCGKRFVTPFGENEAGTGINLFDNRMLSRRYRFQTRIEPSLLDGQPCLAVGYPALSLVSGTRDEIRRIDGGLLLGRGYYRAPLRKEPAFSSFFALCPLAAD